MSSFIFSGQAPNKLSVYPDTKKNNSKVFNKNYLPDVDWSVLEMAILLQVQN